MSVGHEAKLPQGVDGTCDERFAEIPRLLSRQVESGEHHGAAIAVYHRGRPVVDIWGGKRGLPGDERPWTEDTIVVSFSTTKGPAAVALHMACERAGLSYDTPVVEVWPEFATEGGDAKRRITIRHCLCHEAGVPQIRGEIPGCAAMADWDAMVAMVERLTPVWEPDTENGYHAINYGWLVGELVRRIDGRHLTDFLAEEIAGPLSLDGCYIGTPSSEHDRVAPLVRAPLPEGAPSLESLMPPDSLTAKALSPDGDIVEFLNTPDGMATCGPAFSGAFTARSLARLYSALERGGELEGVRLLRPETVEAAATVQNTRPDLVIMLPVHWRLGFMGGGWDLSPCGPNIEAFGHAGFGGSVAFADPRSELAIAILLDQLEMNLLGGDRVLSVVRAALAAAEG
jgi:CubicO group peptidase (beta-lactamase class C family)